MRIGLFLFGITYHTGRHGNKVDFRHCWPNIYEMLIKPFEEQGHTIKIFTCTYIFTDTIIHHEFNDMIKPCESLFLPFQGSNKTTCKKNLFRLITDRDDIDVVIYTRYDIHFNKKIATQNIDLTKFNFLFPEGHYWENEKLTTDNFYIWPYHMTENVKSSLIQSMYHRPYLDTHALFVYLSTKIPQDQIHFISTQPELSDTNSFYTLCIPDMIREGRSCINPDVLERYT
jgi:hypothetical protein